MNTVKLYQAIGANPSRTIKELSDITGIPYKSAKRALQQLLETGRVEPCGAEKNGYGVAYRYKLTVLGFSLI